MPETPNREVNAEEITLNLDDDSDNSQNDADETVIPPVDEDAEDAEPEGDEPDEESEDDESDNKDEDEPEDSPESSPEDGDPADENADDPDDPSHTPAPVPNETPREKALRLELTRVKRENRILATKSVINVKAAEVPPETNERLAKLRERYSDEEIQNMEEAIGVLAEKHGFVKATDMVQNTVNGILEGFLEEHPEYKPENDTDDVRWNRFQDILKSGIYNLSGKTPTQVKEIFKRVNRDVAEELGETEKKTTPARDPKKLAAQQQKVKVISHGGGTKVTPAKKPATESAPVPGLFKGFDKDDFGD